MKGQMMLYISQHNERIFARTVASLKEQAGAGRVFKIYRDTASGPKHVGYGVGSSWFDAYIPYRGNVA